MASCGIILLLLIMSITLIHMSTVLIADDAMTTLVEISSRYPFCKVHTDRGHVQRMLLHADPRRTRQVSLSTVMELTEQCRNSADLGKEFRGHIGLKFPGTKWCGPDDKIVDSIQHQYDDLGKEIATDLCCRDHYHCPNRLKGGECKRGLCNMASFTRSHCDCEEQFKRCLQTVNTDAANTVGTMYFNMLQVICFRERSPCSAHQKVGYNKTIQDEICAQWQYQPSDKYIPSASGRS